MEGRGKSCYIEQHSLWEEVDGNNKWVFGGNVSVS